MADFFEELERELRASRDDPRAAAALFRLGALRREFETNWCVRRIIEFVEIRDALRTAAQRRAPKTVTKHRPRGRPFPVRFQRARIEAALEANSHNVAAAAKAVGCSRHTVYDCKRKKSDAIALDTRDISPGFGVTSGS